VGDETTLSGVEIVMLIEGLAALIPFHEDTAYGHSSEERERWVEYSKLRQRLKQAVCMSFYDVSRGWLDQELRREREALINKLHAILVDLLRPPGAKPAKRPRGLDGSDVGAARKQAIQAKAAELDASKHRTARRSCNLSCVGRDASATLRLSRL
jgi:hypothetical protein